MKNEVTNLYAQLNEKFGEAKFFWPQWCADTKSIEEKEKIVIGMILVQRTSWHNANIALKKLKTKSLLSVGKIAETDLEVLTEIIRPAGFWQSKPKRLIDICKYIVKQEGIEKLANKSMEEIRSEILEIKGIGPETADTIMLYALDKTVFIIDEYTRRWVEKHKIANRNLKYDELQRFFEDNLPRELKVYRDLHALIIISQRGIEKGKMEVV